MKKLLSVLMLICITALVSFAQDTPCETLIYQKTGFSTLTAQQKYDVMIAQMNSLMPSANFNQQMALDQIITNLTPGHYEEGNILPPPYDEQDAKDLWGTGYEDAFSVLGKDAMDLVDMWRQVPTTTYGQSCTCAGVGATEPRTRDCPRGSYCSQGDCDATWFGCGWLYLSTCDALCWIRVN